MNAASAFAWGPAAIAMVVFVAVIVAGVAGTMIGVVVAVFKALWNVVRGAGHARREHRAQIANAFRRAYAAVPAPMPHDPKRWLKIVGAALLVMFCFGAVSEARVRIDGLLGVAGIVAGSVYLVGKFRRGRLAELLPDAPRAADSVWHGVKGAAAFAVAALCILVVFAGHPPESLFALLGALGAGAYIIHLGKHAEASNRLPREAGNPVLPAMAPAYVPPPPPPPPRPEYVPRPQWQRFPAAAAPGNGHPFAKALLVPLGIGAFLLFVVIIRSERRRQPATTAVVWAAPPAPPKTPRRTTSQSSPEAKAVAVTDAPMPVPIGERPENLTARHASSDHHYRFAILTPNGEDFDKAYGVLQTLVRTASKDFVGTDEISELPRNLLVESFDVGLNADGTQLEATLSPENTRMMYNRLTAPGRVWWLAQAYVGMALAAGGLALLLRIGTGVRLPWQRRAA